MVDDVDPGFTQAAPPFATADDLAKRWHAFTDEETLRVDALLEDASVIVMAWASWWQLVPPAVLRVVVCDMVKRGMLNEDMGGVTQSTQTANGFTESLSYANPTGDLYLSSLNKQMLRAYQPSMWHVDLSTGEVGP